MPEHLLDHPVVGERYFFPRTQPLHDPFVVVHDGVQLHCHHVAPHPGAPTVVHFHGNGEIVADWIHDFAPRLVEAGLNVCLAAYRGYGGSSGRPALVAMLDDAVAVADALGVPPETMIVYGRSVGSIYALHVASRRPVGGLVLESGISNVLQRLAVRLSAEELGVTDTRLEQAVGEVLDHRAKLRRYAGPVLVMHARDDHLVPLDHAKDLASWAGDQGRLLVFDRGDHNTIHYFNGETIAAEVVQMAAALG